MATEVIESKIFRSFHLREKEVKVSIMSLVEPFRKNCAIVL